MIGSFFSVIGMQLEFDWGSYSSARCVLVSSRKLVYREELFGKVTKPVADGATEGECVVSMSGLLDDAKGLWCPSAPSRFLQLLLCILGVKAFLSSTF